MDRKLTHELPVTVARAMTDKRGHLNYIQALRLLELAQAALLESRGTNWDDIDRRFGVVSVVRDVEATYHSQLWPGERVVVRTTLTIDGARLHFSQEIVRDGVTCVSYRLVRAFTKAFKPIRVPEELVEQLFGASTPRTV